MNLKKLVDQKQDDSLSVKLRKKRFALFTSLISTISHPIKILDVGGTQIFWERMDFMNQNDVEFVLLNLDKQEVTHKNFKSIVGDARNLSEFDKDEFDIVFSNSVIEHVGNFNDQQCMAKEVDRVGKRYFVQTPNYYFPIEPHFVFPFIQFLPKSFGAFLFTRFDLGVKKKVPDWSDAYRILSSYRLLKKREMRLLFPEAKIFEEKIYGLTKSFIAYKGWH